MKKTPGLKQAIAGFTLVEMLVVVAIVGILSAIAAPSWLAFLDTQRLNAAQDGALRAMREAQSSARREKQTWEASFRDSNNQVQWSVHSANLPVANWTWNNLIGEDSGKITAANSTLFLDGNGNRRVRFGFNGWVTGQQPLGRITFAPRDGGNTRRCVFVSTLLGALRTANDNDCS